MADSIPKISIIVPVYNVAEYLPQCLDSLVNQTYPNLEIICVNDGSTDNSKEILDEYSKKYDSIRVFDQHNSGASVARNVGITASTGDWLMFVDSDDWIDLNTCEDLLGEALSNKTDIIMCGYVKEYTGKQIQVHIFEQSFVLQNDEVKQVHRRLFGPVGPETANPQNLDILISPCMQLFNKTLLKDVFFPDIREFGTFEDGLFQISVYDKCNSFQYIDKCFYHYRKTNSSSITTQYKKHLPEQFEKQYETLEKIITEHVYSDDYRVALNNRVVFSLIGLILNESNAKECISVKAKRSQLIISKCIYQRAFEKLDWSYLPLKWTIFFKLLEKRKTRMIILLLAARHGFVHLDNKWRKAE